MISGKVIAVNISKKKGTVKENINSSNILKNGLEYDAHAGDWHRQVSLLAIESINKMNNLGVNITPGIFAENITTEGLELYSLPLGTLLTINNVILEVTQIGKECHHGCEIMQKVGRCIMPKEGIFTKVIQPGIIQTNDIIQVQFT